MLKTSLHDLLKKRVLILDGAMGTMIQRYNLTEQDYRGEQFCDLPGQMKGNNDMLSLTRPDVIKSIHEQYLLAGADIIETNTFNSTAISLGEYGLEKYVREFNITSANLAREVVNKFTNENPEKPRFVAGSIGPTNKTASISADVNDPASRSVTFDELVTSYKEQIEALIEGKVDVLLIETIFDTLNAKAALFAAKQAMTKLNRKIPIMLSVTLSGKSGRLLSGQTLDAFLASVQHANILSVGLNCSFGASDMKPFLKELGKKAPYYISAYPNAGLPNRFGEYDETPEKMAEQVREYTEEGLVNILGGCCGTTPEHIAQYAYLVQNASLHIPAPQPDSLWLSGLELLEVKPEKNFANIGERCNVAGSRKFLRLIKEKKYDEALEIARKQVEDGAQIIDINMDDGMLDTKNEMIHFLNLLVSDPNIARVPIMIDSSKWEVIEAGLKCLQGKSIVNSISLKEGEDVFLARAKKIQEYGAAVVVMAFDEKGQADIFERKIEVCERAYRLLVDKLQFNPNDIIFDPNVLAVATGMETDSTYALDFIKAVEWIKQNLPGAKISGGISNLSFSFRGNNYIREAMHAVFLYYATQKGMDMGIVNPSTALPFEEIPKDALELIEDVILNRRNDATERLIEYAEGTKELVVGGDSEKKQAWRELNVEERLEYSLIKGISDFLEEDLREALEKYIYAVDIIDKVLMSGMNKVGDLFGAGKLFLPQVVKTARTMKKAVDILQPAIEAEKKDQGSSTKGKFLIATVKGDVHDIGKNIVSVVLSCNNYEVIDLGVMTPPEKIIQAAIENRVDFIGLSGLITPSLEEMCIVAEEMEKAGMSIPLLIGGATTSKLHTAVKIAPKYSGVVVHGNDASQCPVIATKLIDPESKADYIKSIRKKQEELRDSLQQTPTLISLKEAQSNALQIDWKNYVAPVPNKPGKQVLEHIEIKRVIPYINWRYFFTAWKLGGNYEGIEQIIHQEDKQEEWLNSFSENEREKAQEAIKLYTDAIALLNCLVDQDKDLIKAIVEIYPAHANNDIITVGEERIPVLRQQTQKKDPDAVYYALSDFVMPESAENTDYVGAFALTAGNGLDSILEEYEKQGDHYQSLLLKSLTDRLAEAAAEYLHELVRKDIWGYAANENLDMKSKFKAAYQGIRPAIGYPSLPDQSINFQLDKLLDLSRIGIKLTENGAMFPNASVSGLFLAHPQSVYFAIGKIDEVQLNAYSKNKDQPVENVKKWLSGNIL